MSKRVLVVDDDRTLREMLTVALELDGYEVGSAPDGLAALEAVIATPPQLVILDIMMPRMDGFSFAEALATRGLRDQLLLLVLTADGRAGQKAARIGADDWMEKPFDVNEFLDCVARLVGST